VFIPRSCKHNYRLLQITVRFITARCTVEQNAVLRLHVVCPSVLPSVPLSACDVGGSGAHRLEILETNCTEN